MSIQRVTTPLLLVVSEILSAPTEQHYGYGLHEETGLAAATVQRILTRLEDGGLLESSWEDIDPHIEGRRPKRLYTLTGQGETVLSELLEENRSRLPGQATPTRNPRPGWAI